MRVRQGILLLGAMGVSGLAIAADFSKEIAEVRSGQRQEAFASWWGFDRANATGCLQAAINSGVKKLTIDNVGHEWIVDPIQLAGNQEIVFARGVVVRARPGGFKDKNDCLFKAVDASNIVLRGEGTVLLKMNKTDYQRPELYSPAEWRHTLALLSCEQVTIKNLQIQSSGGDGIYIGNSDSPKAPAYCKDILIERVIATDHHRQGISIISARNLTVRNCVFNNTSGTMPQSGIDFEPNQSGECLVNCLLDNCEFNGNRGSGIEFFFNPLNEQSQPVSITVRNCRMNGNRQGIFLMRGGCRKLNGKIEFIDCQVGDSKTTNVVLADIVPEKFPITFKNCTIDNRNSGKAAAIVASAGQVVGDLHFDAVKILTPNLKREPVCFRTNDGNFAGTRNISGTIQLYNGLKTQTIVMEQWLSEREKWLAALQEKLNVPVEVSRLTPPSANTGKTVKADSFRLRTEPTFLQWGMKGQEFKVSLIPWAFAGKDAFTITVYDPRGKRIRQVNLVPGTAPQEVKFQAEETGLYRLEGSLPRQTVEFRSAARGQGLWFDHKSLNLISPEGKLYFQVPAGVSEFSILIAGDSGETLCAALIDPNGKKVQVEKDFDVPTIFTAKRDRSDRTEIWAVEFHHAVEDVNMRFLAPLIPLVAADPTLLLQPAL